MLAKLAHFVGGQAAGLLSKDTISKAGNAYFFHGLDPAYQKSYAQTYWRHDPMAELASCEVEQIVSISELIPHHVFRRSVFYQQWSRPQGWIDAVKAVLDKSATSFAYLSVCRNEASGLVDSEMRARMALVVPHVRRATVIGKVIDLRRAEAAAFADVLDGLSAGVFLVDAKGMIMHANVAARAQLEAGTVLHAVQGQLIVIDPASNRRLRDMITATGGGDAAIGNTDVALALPAPTGDHHVAHVLPLTAGKRADAATPGASAAVFVRKAELQGPSSPQTIGALYRLTPAELRVLLAVVDVGGVPEVAAALGVADSTIKTHLGRIFEKTGANRQADLVKLVAGFSTPLAS
ncbi:MAG: LuxR C-terminal-related transcriptional regulator [Pseudomonadota bacterium]